MDEKLLKNSQSEPKTTLFDDNNLTKEDISSMSDQRRSEMIKTNSFQQSSSKNSRIGDINMSDATMTASFPD